MSAPDIVERLERLVACDPACRGRCKACPEEEAREGAREITALREQLKEAQNLKDVENLLKDKNT